ncbi:helix-turn-helix domain-containing protein [Paenibacillus sp. CAU 1782]
MRKGNMVFPFVQGAGWRYCSKYIEQIQIGEGRPTACGHAAQVAEIAADVGFDCAIHFTRKFRDIFGETPSAYRKRKMAGMHVE